MDEGFFSMNIGPKATSNTTDDDYTGEGTPLTDAQRNVLIVFHYLPFVFLAVTVFVFVKNYEILKSRIWSPFLLVTALIWLQVGPAFEIGDHFYVNNWQLYDADSNLINASFSFFNFGSLNILALSLRLKGLPLRRCPPLRLNWTYLLDWVVVIFDFLFIILTIAQPFVYVGIGRQASVTFLSPIGGLSGIFILFRLWFNCGPNVYTKWGGIGYLFFALCGVAALSVYRQTGLEWVHIFIGGSFVTSVIPLTIGLYFAEPAGDATEADKETGYGGTGETTPLNV